MSRGSEGGWISRSFRRVTSSVAYIPQLDGLRSLALLLVIGHHVFAGYLTSTHRLGTQLLPRDWDLIAPRSALVPWGKQLAFGVQIFFAISGFVLAMPFARAALDRSRAPSTKLYLLRRLVRLEPPYFLSMTLFFFLVVHPWGQPHWRTVVNYDIFGPHYLASIAYLHALIYGTPSWLGGIAWTLEIEIQFYLLMPLLALLFRLRNVMARRLIFVGMTIVAGLFAQLIVPHLANPRYSLSLLGNLEFFLAGVLLTDIYLAPPSWLHLRPRVGDLLAACSAALLIVTVHWGSPFAWTEPFLVIAFYFGVFRNGWLGRLFGHAALTIPGTMCYTIYLYHVFVIQLWMPIMLQYLPTQHALWFDTLVQMILLLPVLLCVAAVLYLGIERPFVVLSHWVTRRWRPAAHPAVSTEAAA